MSGYELKNPNPDPTQPPTGYSPPPPRRQAPPPPPPPRKSWLSRLLLLGLIVSIGYNFYMHSQYESYFTEGEEPIEKFYSGSETAEEKIAVIKVSGVIISPNTQRILKQLKHAQEDETVKGVLLSIDSPGGAVADSHEIYHRVSELKKTKPVIVHMKSMAASGGLYVAMGTGEKGKIYAEPTTWTGSIGVIIPRMEMTGLAEKVGIDSKPIKTGPFKDALSPFRILGDEELAVWENIINQAFDRFLNVIADNRPDLDYEAVKKLATGEVYTATDALDHKLIDEIAFEETAIQEVLKRIGRGEDDVRVVTYESTETLIEAILGSAQAQAPEQQWQLALESTVPRPMYCCSWLAGLTSGYFSKE